jgi:hypothetical protein
MMQNIKFIYEVAAHMFFFAVVFHDCHQIHLNHPFPINSSFIFWLVAVNGWADGYHGRHDLGFLLVIQPLCSSFLTYDVTYAATCDLT